jgi:hypothetical protein
MTTTNAFELGLVNVHHPSACAFPLRCVIHHPSYHHMRDMPLNWRADRGLMERICQHGVGHPDPDQAYFNEQTDRAYENVHGCDGCCAEPAPYEGRHRAAADK